MISNSADLVPQFHIYIEQGVTFQHTFQWIAGPVIMRPIELITEGYPTVVTVTAHGLNTISSHPVIISGVEGCFRLNSQNNGIPLCTRMDDNQFSIPLSSVGQTWVPGTGEITYVQPTDLTNMTGKCVIRKNWYSPDVIYEMNTSNGGMVLTPEDGSIALNIPKNITASFTFRNAWYDVDLTAPDTTEVRVFKGPITLEREVSP